MDEADSDAMQDDDGPVIDVDEVSDLLKDANLPNLEVLLSTPRTLRNNKQIPFSSRSGES